MSRVEARIAGRTFRFDSARYVDLSIPLSFQDEGLSAFGVPPASVRTVETVRFTGDTRRGGSCNVREYRITPHCHGTHTECVSHIVDQEISVAEVVEDACIPATLISITLEKGEIVRKAISPAKKKTIFSLLGSILSRSWSAWTTRFSIRRSSSAHSPTHPPRKSDDTPQHLIFPTRQWAEIARRKVNHLLVDVPSVDRMDDQGNVIESSPFLGSAVRQPGSQGSPSASSDHYRTHLRAGRGA